MNHSSVPSAPRGAPPSSPVLGAAVAAFSEVCPDDFELLHRSYRKLCHLLADMDEWAQILTLNCLVRYARVQFVDPAPGASDAAKVQAQQRAGAGGARAREVKKIKRRVVKKAFYSDEEDESDEEEIVIQTEEDDAIAEPGAPGAGGSVADVEVSGAHRHHTQ